MATVDTIQNAYLAYYGRPADPAGLDYWTGVLEDAGGNLDAIIADFGYSDEYTQQFGHLDTDALITAVYQRLFGRDPDAAGLEFYRDQLTSQGKHLGTIALDIFNGATGGDRSLLNDITETADWFTQMVREMDLPYHGDRGLAVGTNLIEAFHHEYFEYRHQRALERDERDAFRGVETYDTKPLFTAGWFAVQLNEDQTIITIDSHFDTGYYNALRLQWPKQNQLTIHGTFNDLDPYSWDRGQEWDEDGYYIYNIPAGNYEIKRTGDNIQTDVRFVFALQIYSNDIPATVPDAFLDRDDHRLFWSTNDSLQFRTEDTLNFFVWFQQESGDGDYTLTITRHSNDADFRLLAPSLTTFDRQTPTEVLEINAAFNDLLFIG